MDVGRDFELKPRTLRNTRSCSNSTPQYNQTWTLSLALRLLSTT